MSDDATGSFGYACPACGAAAAPAPDRSNILVCTACRSESFVPDADEFSATPDEAPEVSRGDELDAARVRRFATQRRAINRTASYFVVAAGVCVVAVVQLVWLTVQHVRAAGWTPRPVGYLLFVVLALWGAWYCTGRAGALRREAMATALPEPTTPPDFSTLDDGSKHWKNLEDIR